MAITTLANVKIFLNTTSTTKDAWIEALIPMVENDYKRIRNKPFDLATKINIETTGLPADEEITVEVGNHAAVGGAATGREYDIRLRSGDTAKMIAYRIIQQMKPSAAAYFNFELRDASTSSADIYLSERFPQFQEWISALDVTLDTSTSITSTVSDMQTVYPEGSELTAIQMINYQMSKPEGVQSESLGDWSVTYAQNSGGYPSNITAGIQKFAVTL
jgi:hypothetical protein